MNMHFRFLTVLSLCMLPVLIFAQTGIEYIARDIQVTPKQNIVLKSNPQPLSFVVHYPNTALEGVYYESERIDYDQLPFSGLQADKQLLSLPYSMRITIDETFFETLAEGEHMLEFRFENDEVHTSKIEITTKEKLDAYALKIININVEHGVAVLVMLPDTNILIDAGTEGMAAKRVIPFFKDFGVEKIDYMFITHWHKDHYGGLHKILEAFEVGKVWYNLSEEGKKESGLAHDTIFTIGNEFSISEASFQVLNAARFDSVVYPGFREKEFGGYAGKNNRSLSFNMEYNDFIYSHGGDIYQHPQRAILKSFGEDVVRAHVYHGNHHFHGGIDSEYLKIVDPYLFITPAQHATYNRKAFTDQVMGEVVPYLQSNSDRFIENLFDFEVGNIVIYANDPSDWKYMTR